MNTFKTLCEKPTATTKSSCINDALDVMDRFSEKIYLPISNEFQWKNFMSSVDDNTLVFVNLNFAGYNLSHTFLMYIFSGKVYIAQSYVDVYSFEFRDPVVLDEFVNNISTFFSKDPSTTKMELYREMFGSKDKKNTKYFLYNTQQLENPVMVLWDNLEENFILLDEDDDDVWEPSEPQDVGPVFIENINLMVVKNAF